MIYLSPDDAAGNFEPANLIKSIQQNSNSLDEDQQMLLDIEQNIANLERSLNQSDTDAAQQQKKKHILKRVMSSSHHQSGSGSGGGGGTSKSSNSRPNTSSGGGGGGIAEKRVSLKAVRNFMKLGRSRNHSQSRDSSTEDEGRFV